MEGSGGEIEADILQDFWSVAIAQTNALEADGRATALICSVYAFFVLTSG